MSVQDRFQILDNPIVLPGKCGLCGISHNGGDRKFIDTGLDLDWYGTFYICTFCFHEISKQLGYIKSVDAEEDKKLLEQIIVYHEEAMKENESLRNSVSALSGHTCRQPASSTPSVPPSGGKEVPKKPVEVGKPANAEDAKPNVSKGPANPGGAKSNDDADFFNKLGL